MRLPDVFASPGTSLTVAVSRRAAAGTSDSKKRRVDRHRRQAWAPRSSARGHKINQLRRRTINAQTDRPGSDGTRLRNSGRGDMAVTSHIEAVLPTHVYAVGMAPVLSRKSCALAGALASP